MKTNPSFLRRVASAALLALIFALAYVTDLRPFDPVAPAGADEATCRKECSATYNRCMSGCASGEQGRGCRTGCGAAAINCGENCDPPKPRPGPPPVGVGAFPMSASCNTASLTCVDDCCRAACASEPSGSRARCMNEAQPGCVTCCHPTEHRNVSGEAEPAKDWVCSGPVNDCRSAKHDGTFGCLYSAGAGSTQGKAYAATREDCEEQLKVAHGGNFHCNDLTQVSCRER